MTEEYYKNLKKIASNPAVLELKKYPHHVRTTSYNHCLNVAMKSYAYAKRFHIKVREEELARGAMLHDFYFYCARDEKMNGFKHGKEHPYVALENARSNFDLSPIEENIIGSHMWPLNIRNIPRSREAVLVCIVDKICAVQERCGKVRVGMGGL